MKQVDIFILYIFNNSTDISTRRKVIWNDQNHAKYYVVRSKSTWEFGLTIMLFDLERCKIL